MMIIYIKTINDIIVVKSSFPRVLFNVDVDGL